MIETEVLQRGFYERYLKELTDTNNPVFDEIDIQPNGQPYVVNYHGRRHIFAYATFPISLFSNAAPLFTVPLAANVWTNISFREGERLFTSTGNTQFLIKCTNEDVP